MAELVEVRFLPADVRVWVRPGPNLVEVAGQAGLEIVTGCTEGMCGTDPVRIVAGAELLSPWADHERGTLERMGLERDHRLACSARIGASEGALTVELDAF